jgi:RimJ/RimL family protein N-acetyltransferase
MAQLSSPRRTDRLTLRPFEDGDLDALAQMFASEEVCRYIYREIKDREETKLSLDVRRQHPSEIGEDNMLPVAVALTATNQLIGDFMLRWARNEHHQGEIGGSLLPPYFGNGYATEIYRELLVVGFETYDLHRIFGNCDARNRASIRSLEKAGFVQEAHLVENEFVKGEWTDEVIMAIRRSTWTRASAADTIDRQ